MDAAHWYGAALALLLAALCVARIGSATASRLAHAGRALAATPLLRHVVYPSIHRYLQGSECASYADYAALAAFVGANGLAAGLGIGRRGDVRSALLQRLAQLALANSVPLWLGGHSTGLAALTGLRLRVFRRCHRWLGRVALFEAFLHALLALVWRRADPKQASVVAGIVVSSEPTSCLRVLVPTIDLLN